MNPDHSITVKLISKASGIAIKPDFAPQCPNNQPQWRNCRFVSDLSEREYDWLVVVDGLSRDLPGGKEVLACPRQNTILVTTEPSSVTRYGKAYAAQFGTVLTSQEKHVLPHPNGIRSHTGNVWFYGRTFDEVVQAEPPEKTELISTVCSSKQQAYTMHALRYAFTQKLKAELPELEIFGHGVKFVEKKADALDPFKFHLAIENHIAQHHWTEKLADAFLGWTVPIYCGCPNIYDYFPEESLICIDINDFDSSLRTIQKVLASPDEYERRFEAVAEARRRVIEEYNIPAMLSHLIESSPPAEKEETMQIIYSRRNMRVRQPMEFIRFAVWRINNLLKKPGLK